MQMSDFRPAKDFARKYGAKSLVFGRPGSGKTPVANTAPRPIMMVCEPGMLSMRNSTIPAIDCFTPERIDEFFQWLFGSKETVNFDTVVIDSTSQMAEIYLDRELAGKSKSGNKVDGKAAYGAMARKVREHLNGLFFLQQKHTYLICKQGYAEIDGVRMAVPSFPGQDLPVFVPHLYDVIMHLGIQAIPGHGQVKAFRCVGSYDTMARDRSGSLAEFEPCDLTAIFNKVMA
jgi:hypothetical protein